MKTLFQPGARLKLGICGAFGIWILELGIACAGGGEINLTQLPPPANRPVDFARDIQPIFESSCLKCHGPLKAKSHFRLDTRAAALKGGENNADDLVPGDSGRSKLIHYVTGLVPDFEMPPEGKGEPLTGTEIGLLRAWIDQGAEWSAATLEPTELSIEPMTRWTSVSGDRNKFREIEGVEPGWAGGLGRFAWRKPMGPDASFSGEGHAIYPDDDFQLKLALQKTDVGFVHAGVETRRKYFDDTGGFAPLLPTNSFNLNRDLSLLLGRAWIDFGLLFPDKPQVVLGYEYQFKQGNEATLQWGPVGTLPLSALPTDAKNIYPASKHIDEGTHVLKLDVTHEMFGWQLADSARVEFYNLATKRQNLLDFPNSDTTARVAEHDSHTQGANTFSVNKSLRDWLSVSGAYFYSRLDGSASLRQNTVDGSGAFAVGDQWIGDATMIRETHSGSVSSLIGPWQGLTLSLDAQGEWTSQDAMGFSNLRVGDPNAPPLIDNASRNIGNFSSASARENAALRYTTIPWTVLFGEVRLRQESFSRFENRPDATALDPLTYHADEDIQSQEYRAGFNTSPWPRLSFGADFRHRNERTDYTHSTVFNPAGYQYPGFFNWRNIADDQVETRLVYRATSWLKTSFSFRWQKTDFDSSTIAVPTITDGGLTEAGNYQAHVYSFNAVLTPVRRLFLSGTFSYSDSRTMTLQNGANYLAPYQGNTYSVLSSATFALNADTHLRATYVFSKSGYAQHNLAGLPLGIDYESHSLQAGVTHRFNKNLLGDLAYGFAQYHEPTSADVNDFTAHSIFATVTILWR